MIRFFRRLSILALAWMVCPAMTWADLLDMSGEPDPTDQSNSMLLWLRADEGFSASQWSDQSTHGFDATQANSANQPTLAATGLNGAPVVLFDGDDFMGFGPGLTLHQTMFIVYQDTSTQSWVTPLGTTYNGKGSYHGHSDGSGLFNSANTDGGTVNGRNFRNGVNIGNGLSTPRPVDYALDIHVANDPLQQVVNFLGSDSCCGDPPAGRAIAGGIAEVILYDRTFNDGELNGVQNYLANKYSLSVEEIKPPVIVMPNDGNAISLNFASGPDLQGSPSYDMAPDMVAGVLPTNSWTNLHMASGVENNLVGNLNQPTSASVEWSSNGTWETTIPASDGDTTMMKSHLDARASGFDPPEDASVTVSDLPASFLANGYDVYVYFDAATYPLNRWREQIVLQFEWIARERASLGRR